MRDALCDEAHESPQEPRRRAPVRATQLPHSAHVRARNVARGTEKALGDMFLDFDRSGEP